MLLVKTLLSVSHCVLSSLAICRLVPLEQIKMMMMMMMMMMMKLATTNIKKMNLKL